MVRPNGSSSTTFLPQCVVRSFTMVMATVDWGWGRRSWGRSVDQWPVCNSLIELLRAAAGPSRGASAVVRARVWSGGVSAAKVPYVAGGGGRSLVRHLSMYDHHALAVPARTTSSVTELVGPSPMTSAPRLPGLRVPQRRRRIPRVLNGGACAPDLAMVVARALAGFRYLHAVMAD